MVIRDYGHHTFRIPYRPSYGYVMLLLMLLVMCWEYALNDKAIAEGAIPAEAIRLRILANSDSAADQAVKRHVRNAVSAELNRLLAEAKSIEEARRVLSERLPELTAVVRRELQERGFMYDAEAELGLVPFPAKVYGSRIYPAGNYEALLITLGEGKGENWWCVLFPPLCFADAVGTGKKASSAAPKENAGEAAATVASGAAHPNGAGSVDKAGDVHAADGKADAGGRSMNAAGGSVSAIVGSSEAGGGSTNAVGGSSNAAGGNVNADSGAGSERTALQEVEVKFFLAELLQKIADFFKRLFR